jgi:hypothetical protein
MNDIPERRYIMYEFRIACILRVVEEEANKGAKHKLLTDKDVAVFMGLLAEHWHSHAVEGIKVYSSSGFVPMNASCMWSGYQISTLKAERVVKEYQSMGQTKFLRGWKITGGRESAYRKFGKGDLVEITYVQADGSATSRTI